MRFGEGERIQNPTTTQDETLCGVTTLLNIIVYVCFLEGFLGHKQYVAVCGFSQKFSFAFWVAFLKWSLSGLQVESRKVN
jgi:hypothetical protein